MSNDLLAGLDRLSTRDSNNNNRRTGTRPDQLAESKNVDDLEAYLLRLIHVTQSALDEVCNEGSNPFFDSTTGSKFSRTSANSLPESALDGRRPMKDELDYLSALDKEKLLIYRDQLEQAIRKLSADLVNKLEAKDSLYLKRDELFLRIENSTRHW